ncbi:EF-hand domain-containing protein [Ensifer sp. MPMI2T]|nr:EF-hand domain-containing protein [Ensifer sp. MPMI2T]
MMREGDQPGEEEMMGRGMMRRGMMGHMPMMAMRGHMMKIMFAIADADGDGSLSFDEVTAIHKRIFDKVDANKDGKVSTEEIQAFMRP